MSELERYITGLLADQCMPTLLNVKPSTLVSVERKGRSEYLCVEEILRKLLSSYSCFFYLLREGKERLYYVIYQEMLLKNCLLTKENREFLLRYGYQYDDSNINIRILEQLKIRYDKYFCRQGNFPHEIGIILGYPLGDVEGFIKNKGKDYIYCGMWKVYQDAERAKQLFTLYQRMRTEARKQLGEIGNR
jgi:hypothetical protein